MSYKLAGVLWNDDGTMANEGYIAEYEGISIYKDVDEKLKAFEFIRKKEMLSVFKDIHNKCYLAFNTMAIEIPEEEYETLKKVLL